MHTSPIAGLIALVLFALALCGTAFASDNEAKARQLINSLGCKGCHQLDGAGGTLGPGLDKVGERLSADEIRAQMQDPKTKNPASFMPSFAHLPEQDMKLLVEYLAGLK